MKKDLSIKLLLQIMKHVAASDIIKDMNLSVAEREYVETLYGEVKVKEPKEQMRIKYWFDRLPDDVMQRALMNSAGWALEREVSSLAGAIMDAFIWVESPEGRDYWAKIYCDILDGKK